VIYRWVKQITFIASLAASTVYGGWDHAAPQRLEAMQLAPDYERGKVIYEICAVCHMPEGWGTSNGAYPQIAGQHRSVVIKQLADIRAKNRDNPSMFPFSIDEALGGAQAISDVAYYIEGLKMTSSTGKGEGVDLKYGEKLYQQNCTQCHGARGEGDSDHAYPAVHSQHYHYLLRQLIWLQNGKRRNANRKMMEVLDGFALREFKAVSDYISRLPLIESKGDKQAGKDRPSQVR
jgi:cytochrome c553